MLYPDTDGRFFKCFELSEGMDELIFIKKHRA